MHRAREATVEGRIAQVRFRTEPPDAAVSFAIEVDGGGLFLGRGRPIVSDAALERLRALGYAD